MLQSIKEDSIASFLAERCSLTEAQLDTILLSGTEGSLKNKAKLRDKHRVTTGAFVRTLRQGQENIEACIYTMFLLNYLGLVQSEDLERLGRSGHLISRIRESSPDAGGISRLIQAMEDLALGFSKRRKQRFIV
jgi:hypothetical protein